MATTTLSYDEENAGARGILDVVLSTGFFKQEYEPNEETLEAIRELREGNCKSYGSFDEMINDILNEA